MGLIVHTGDHARALYLYVCGLETHWHGYQ